MQTSSVPELCKSLQLCVCACQQTASLTGCVGCLCTHRRAYSRVTQLEPCNPVQCSAVPATCLTHRVCGLSVHTQASLEPLDEKVTAWTPRLPSLSPSKEWSRLSKTNGVDEALLLLVTASSCCLKLLKLPRVKPVFPYHKSVSGTNTFYRQHAQLQAQFSRSIKTKERPLI
jgi:hypothetical protein